MFVCTFGVEVSRFISVVSQSDIYVNERYVSRRVWTGEFDGGVNVVKIVHENFQVIQTFGPDHKNIIDIAQPSVRLKWGIFQSVCFEKTAILCKDTNDFLNKLLTIGNLPANSLLATLDVSSLFKQ